MSDFDLIIRGGTVVTHEGEQAADICIADGKIAALELKTASSAREIIDAGGMHIFPGLIDSHVHFNEPGRADWEGIQTGSRALAAGGGTMFFDMPLNASPPTIDDTSFDLKRAAAEKISLVDFALWGGLGPDNLDRLDELAERGVVGFKAFMCNSGIEDFPGVTDRQLREGMARAAKLKTLVAVHAESELVTRSLQRERIYANRTTIRDYLDSRPVEAELDAIGRAVEMAGETGCALHVVHVSCGAGVALIAEARRNGVNVTCETCPHYLVLTEEDMLRLGAVAKCAPPLRTESAQRELWNRLLAGEISTVGSDHSPSPPAMKEGTNFFRVWGGISGAQHTLPNLITGSSRRKEAHSCVADHQTTIAGESQSRLTSAPASVEGNSSLSLIARLTSFNVAERFGLPATKGRIAVGADADLAIANLREEFEVHSDELFYRHPQSPYAGRRLRGRVVRTFVRGQTVFKDGKIVSKPVGRWVRPAA